MHDTTPDTKNNIPMATIIQVSVWSRYCTSKAPVISAHMARKIELLRNFISLIVLVRIYTYVIWGFSLYCFGALIYMLIDDCIANCFSLGFRWYFSMVMCLPTAFLIFICKCMYFYWIIVGHTYTNTKKTSVRTFKALTLVMMLGYSDSNQEWQDQNL